jgi:hypothetical protein
MTYQPSFGIRENEHDTWVEPELSFEQVGTLVHCDCYNWPEVSYCHQCRHACICHRTPMKGNPQ